MILLNPGWSPAYAAAGGPVVRTGTASQVNASAGDGSTSVSVPADATVVVAFVSHWDGNGGSKLATLTLNSASFTEQTQITEGAGTDKNGIGVLTRINPSTGTQTLAWTWSAGGARTEGGEIVLVYVKGANTGDLVRDSDAIANVVGDDTTLTLTTVVGDMLLAFCQGGVSSTPALDGTVFIDSAALNSHVYDASEVTAGAGSTVINMTGEDYSSMAAIALKSL